MTDPSPAREWVVSCRTHYVNDEPVCDVYEIGYDGMGFTYQCAVPCDEADEFHKEAKQNADQIVAAMNVTASKDAQLATNKLEIAQCHRDMDEMRKLLTTRVEASRLDEANSRLAAKSD